MKKRTMALCFLLIFSVAMLAACGKDTAPKTDDPKPTIGDAAVVDSANADMLGEYQCTGVSFDDFEMGASGEWMKLESDTRGVVCIAGNEYPFTWSMDGNNMSIAEDVGVTFPATYENGIIKLETGMTYVFEKSAAPKGGDTTSGQNQNAPADVDSTALPEGMAWWDGQWYGWYVILEGKGAFSQLDDSAWDCAAFADMNDDGTGTLYLWDNYAEIGTVDVLVDLAEGSGMMGEMSAVSGAMFGVEVEEGDWYVDPGDVEYDDLFYIYGDVRLSNDDYARYEIYLRPWGATWDDMSADLQPIGYDDWYLGEAFSAYDSMLDALAETAIDDVPVYIHEGLPARAWDANGTSSGASSGTLGNTKVDAPAPAANNGPAPGGDGITTFTNVQLSEFSRTFINIPRDKRDVYTYEMVRDEFFEGIEGEFELRESEGLWQYIWYASDVGFAKVIFKSENGYFDSWSTRTN